ncbi:MAG: VanW family protein, partial [Acidimicrobiia bacterium]|nr:VanW family protein [Acidimicrobiia bacterium]
MTPEPGSGELTLQEKRAITRAANRRANRLILLAALPIVLIVAFYAAWAVDAAIHSDQSQRNVDIAGVAVGGLSQTDLDARVGEIAADYGSTPVEIVLPDQVIETTAADVGLVVDRQATVDAANDVGGGFVLTRPFGWFGRLFSAGHVDLRFAAAELDDAPALHDLETAVSRDPVEPTVAFESGELVLIPGEPGLGIDPAAILEQLPAAAAGGTAPVRLAAALTEIPPAVSDDLVAAEVARGNQLSATGLTLSIESEAARQVGAGELRSWLTLTTIDGELSIGIDADVANEAIFDRFSDVGDLGAPGPISIIDGQPMAEPGTPGQICCTPDSADRVLAALEAGEDTVRLDFERVDRGEDWLEEIGIIELVGEFTTEHACCQGRVTNIQRMAEIVRGQIIEPGDTFSINDFVGRRTVDDGFVAGGVIYQGVFQTDVGGGVSQFATTFFNASFFAGLDFADYQAHTIYISRYPYGREATISFPAPDLAVTNTTDFPVLIWTDWTDTSITVQLYSTQHIVTTETGQVTEAAGACTRVTTLRERAYPDGSVVEDSVFALYQPSEG